MRDDEDDLLDKLPDGLARRVARHLNAADTGELPPEVPLEPASEPVPGRVPDFKSLDDAEHGMVPSGEPEHSGETNAPNDQLGG